MQNIRDLGLIPGGLSTDHTRTRAHFHFSIPPAPHERLASWGHGDRYEIWFLIDAIKATHDTGMIFFAHHQPPSCPKADHQHANTNIHACHQYTSTEPDLAIRTTGGGKGIARTRLKQHNQATPPTNRIGSVRGSPKHIPTPKITIEQISPKLREQRRTKP